MQPVLKEFEEAVDGDNDDLTILCNTQAVRNLLSYIRSIHSELDSSRAALGRCRKVLEDIADGNLGTNYEGLYVRASRVAQEALATLPQETP